MKVYVSTHFADKYKFVLRSTQRRIEIPVNHLDVSKCTLGHIDERRVTEFRIT